MGDWEMMSLRLPNCRAQFLRNLLYGKIGPWSWEDIGPSSPTPHPPFLQLWGCHESVKTWKDGCSLTQLHVSAYYVFNKIVGVYWDTKQEYLWPHLHDITLPWQQSIIGQGSMLCWYVTYPRYQYLLLVWQVKINFAYYAIVKKWLWFLYLVQAVSPYIFQQTCYKGLGYVQ